MAEWLFTNWDENVSDHNIEITKHALDFVAVGAVAGAVIDVLPDIAVTLTIIWMTIRIGEKLYCWWHTDRVKRWTKRNL